MNKRSYILPTTQEVMIDTLYLMSASPEKIPVKEDETVDNEDDLLSRKVFGSWDE